MRIRAIQWAAVNASLNLARSPFDAAITMLPDLGTGAKPAARAAIDAADAGVRAAVATVLGDPDPADQAEAARRPREREERHAGRGRQSKKAAPADQSTAAAKRTPSPLSPQAAQRSRSRGTATARTAERTRQAAASGSRRHVADVVSGEHQTPPASVGSVSLEPTHEEIAARAYELYQRGVPGDAHSHWEAAKRELTTAPR